MSTTRRSPPLATWSSDNHMWWCGTSSARGRATPYACSSGARHPRWLPHLAHQPGGATGTLQAEFVHNSRCRGRDAYAQDAARFQFTDIASPNVVTWRRTRATGATAAPTLRDGVSPAPQARAGPHASAPAEYQPWVGVLLTARIQPAAAALGTFVALSEPAGRCRARRGRRGRALQTSISMRALESTCQKCEYAV